MKKHIQNNSECFFLVFRVIIGIVFILHGVMKLPGIMGGTTEIFSLIALAALIETLGGALIVVGLFTRTVSGIAALEMLYAFGIVHVVGNSWNFNPLANRGEAALLFFAAFLVLFAYGAGKYSIDNKIKK